MRLSEGNRLHVPRALLRLVTWFDGQRNTDIIAELRSPGCVRLLNQEKVQEKIESLRIAIASRIHDDPEALDALFALEDRYRSLTLYADGRARLTEAVLLHLGITPGEFPYLMIQVAPEFIDIMSLMARSERLSRFRDQTSLDAEPNQSSQ